MTTKDLNLSLDRALLPSNIARDRKPANSEMRHDAAPAGARRANKKAAAKSRQPAANSRPGMAAACIATANMLFLVLAGVWLSGFADRLPASPAAAPADIAPRLARIEQSITTLEQQLADLQVAANAQQQLIVSAYQSIGDHLQARPDQAPATATQTTPGARAPGETPAMAATPAAARSWYVDLGSFPSNKAAVEVQKSLQALGFDAQIKAGSGGGTPTHELILANFEDRASAEVIATQLMEQTELESVSVWKSE